MYLKFWGVRGSFPVSSQDVKKYGGNTSCIEVNTGKTLIVLDGGSGLYNLGKTIVKENKFKDIHIFLTHTHLDHIMGLVNFAPMYNSNYTIYIYGPKRENCSIKDTLNCIFSQPIWPISISQAGANVIFRELSPSDQIDFDENTKVINTLLDHPNGSIGYRIFKDNKSITYLTDLGHSDTIHPSLLKFCSDSDALIYDSHFTQDEYNSPKYSNWGHSCWEKGVSLSIEANVKNHFIFHHAPERNDLELDFILKNALELRKNVFIATEGFLLNT